MNMKLPTIGSEIEEYAQIDTIFPTSDSTFNLSDTAGSMHHLFDNVQGVIFPVKKLMWPIMHKVSRNVYRRMPLPMRSVKATMYSFDNIFLVSNTENGIWVFVRHETTPKDDEHLSGFVATLSDVAVQEYGNAAPMDLMSWLGTHLKHDHTHL